MAVRRSNRFNPDVDQELLSLIESVGGSYGPYEVEAISGYRPGDKRFHGRHSALDVSLIDRKTKQALDNYQSSGTAAAYQQFANALYQHALKTNPALAEKLRWGGYFSGGKDTYGALDLMHFDVGGGEGGVPMAGGSWETGFTPEQMKTWGLQSSGGLIPEDMVWDDKGLYHAGGGYTPEQRRAAIASIESVGSGDYNALGPSVARRSGAGPGPTDRAYGRYQVMGSNIGPWAEQYLQMKGITPQQFLADPQLQDKLFDAVYGDYVKQYGERGAASKWFTGSEKEPLTTDVNKKLTGKTYADRYMAALTGGSALGKAVAAGAGKAAGEAATQSTALPETAKDKKSWGEAIGEGLGGIGEAYGAASGEGFSQAPPRGEIPQSQPLQQAPMAMLAENPADQRHREYLAQLMAKYWIT